MRRTALAAAMAVAWCGPVLAEPVPPAPPKPAADAKPAVAPAAAAAPAVAVASAAPQAEDFKPVAFGKLVVKLPVGDPYGVIQGGWGCGISKTATWVGGQVDYHIPAAKETFHDEFTKAGLKVDGDPDNLFEAQAAAGDYVIAGIATEFHQRVCTPNLREVTQKGDIHMAVEWELYSRLQKQVLATVRTTADYEIKDAVSGGGNVMLNQVFAMNLHQLAQSPEIRRLLAGKALAEDELVKPTAESPIVLAGSAGAVAKGVDAEVASVVLVRTGAGHGSGFLISKDGYILTAGHVVGDATTVKIRWSDKTETDGAVVRVSKGRDVALIKTDARGRPPLPLLRTALPPSATVFAVGAPLDQELQGSVTRGVVSAVRAMHGYDYIQSDVSVGPGNSGGPLMDEQGHVVGVTVSGVRILNAPQGINMFVPVNDALSFLSLTPQ